MSEPDVGMIKVQKSQSQEFTMLFAHLTSPEWATVIIGFAAGVAAGMIGGFALARRYGRRL